MKKQSTNQLRIFLFCVFLTSSFLAKAATIYVNPAAVGANNGTSWANAYTSLSNALLAAVNGDEIWVKQGVYKPTTLVDVSGTAGAEAREATFQIPNGVALYGGFAGTEATRAERNWEVNLTILSGDIDNNDTNLDGNSIAEVVTHIVGNNAYHVVYTFNVNASTILDGFIVTAGRASVVGGGLDDINRDGSGWYNKLGAPGNASSPTIRNTTFQGNHSLSDGGAIFNTSTGVAAGAVLSLIENCKFINNKADINGGAIHVGSFTAGNYAIHIVSSEFTGNEAVRRGGALYLLGDHATIDSTTFTSNIVTVVSPDGSTLPGTGGAANLVASNATFNHSIFKTNSSTGNPTGIFEGGGGGAVAMSTNEPQTNSLGISQPKFVSCGFYGNMTGGNTTSWGGAVVQLCDGGKLRPSYVNCVFAGNQAQTDGGAIASATRVMNAAIADLTPTYTNCTFSGNSAGSRGGAMYLYGYEDLADNQLSNVKIVNTIIWGNTATVEGPGIFSTNGSINQISYSLIQGSGGSGGGWNTAIGIDGGNNKDTNPGFVNSGDPDGPDNIPATSDDGLMLIASSAAANAGNSAAPGLAGITTDYRLGARIIGASVDMGAYERAGIVIPDLPIFWLYDWRPFPPMCLSCPWSFLLLDQKLHSYIWDSPAQLVDKGEAAYVKGHIVNPKNKKQGFDVYLKLINKHDWAAWSAKGRTYIAISPEAVATAKASHTRWTFWELSSESYLKGTGDFSGTLKLTHFPTNYKVGFQLGAGANGWDKDLGLGGSFCYRGTILHKGKKLNLSGTGSMNVDAVKCATGCTPEGESLRLVQHEEDTEEPLNVVSKEISVYPIPARTQLTILSDNLDAGKYTVKFYNNKGLLKKQGTLDTDNGNLLLGVEDLDAGIYVLKVISSTGETLSKKLIIE